MGVVVRQHRTTDPGEEWVHFPNDRIGFTVSPKDVLNALGDVFRDGPDLANVCRRKEQGLLNRQAGFQGITPGFADAGSGDNVLQR